MVIHMDQVSRRRSDPASDGAEESLLSQMAALGRGRQSPEVQLKFTLTIMREGVTSSKDVNQIFAAGMTNVTESMSVPGGGTAPVKCRLSGISPAQGVSGGVIQLTPSTYSPPIIVGVGNTTTSG